ncbi:MAG: hypothetical protein AAF623_02310 [Planctomycetota bacterium]
MWRTSSGETVIAGAEGELLRYVIDGMVDSIVLANELNEPCEVGVLLFDKLQPTQQMAMLNQVSNALLRVDAPEPELTATSEATVYAIFRELFVQIELEIYQEQSCQQLSAEEQFASPFAFRSLALAAYQSSMSIEEIEELHAEGLIPDVKSGNPYDWDTVVEGLADRILWDRDFEMEYLMVDDDPAKSELLKSHMGIDSDYFTAIATDISDRQFEQIRDEIRNLVRS